MIRRDLYFNIFFLTNDNGKKELVQIINLLEQRETIFLIKTCATAKPPQKTF